MKRMRAARCIVMMLAGSVILLTAACTPPLERHWHLQPLPAEALAAHTVDVGDVASLRLALERSLAWFDTAASQDAYPVRGITHAHARASVAAFRTALENRDARAGFVLARARDADDTLFTGYYAPEFSGARAPDATHRFPLYRLPPDERRFATRKELETNDVLAGLELCWLADPFDAYIVHVNGSARIRFDDGSHMNIGHSATNELPYTSIGKLLIEGGIVAAEDISLAAIRAYFAQNPAAFERYAHLNDRFVFFEPLPDDVWPRGSTGIALVPMRSLAVDPTVHPPGCAGLIDTHLSADPTQPLQRIVLNHDTGGAIIGPGRADIFIGIGSEAGRIAGAQIAHGSLQVVLIDPAQRARITDRRPSFP